MGNPKKIKAREEPDRNGLEAENFTPQDIARRARLRYVTDSEPGLHRRRCGRGFLYFTPSGQRLTKERHLDRIRSLAIPPAWTDVWICRFATGHLQATGRDSRDRKQYLYHDRWREWTGRAKFSTLAGFGHALPRIRRKIADDLNRKGLSWEKVAALAVSLLDETGVRVGNREYTTKNETYGLTTLQNRHVQVIGSQILLSFNGKGGQKRRIELDDLRLAKLVEECRTVRGKNLLQYESEQKHQPLTSHDVNEYLNSLSPDMTAKTFRTWHGSRIIAEDLFHSQQGKSISARRKVVSEAIEKAADHLGNTRTICRKYYVHPQVIELYLQGQFPEIFEKFSPRRRKRFTTAEQILLRILDHKNERAFLSDD